MSGWSLFRRRALLVVLALLALGTSFAVTHSTLSAAPAAPVPLFVLAGQSNMVGFSSDLNELPHEYRSVQENVWWYAAGDRWQPLQAPTEPLPFSGGVANGTGFGPELSLASVLTARLNRRIALVKYAVNGTSLAERWLPGKDLYQQAIARVRRAKTDLEASGEHVEIAGFFWMQGESDAKSDRAIAQRYAENFRTFWQQLRRDLETPNLPAILGKIPVTTGQTTDFGRFCCGDLVRQAQAQLAREPNIAAVETLDLARDRDNLHLASAGLLKLGRRFARAWLSGR